MSQGVTERTLELSTGTTSADFITKSFFQEFKLNPGAKIFSPTYTNFRSASPPVQCVPSISYVPNNSLLPVAQTEVGIGPYIPHSSVPVKVLPYNHLTAGGEIGTHPEPVRTFHSILLFPDRVLPAELQVGDMVW